MYHSFLLFLIGGCTLFLRSPLFESRKSLIILMSLEGLCFIVVDTVMVLGRQHLGIEWTSLCGAEGDFICWLPSTATLVCLLYWLIKDEICIISLQFCLQRDETASEGFLQLVRWMQPNENGKTALHMCCYQIGKFLSSLKSSSIYIFTAFYEFMLQFLFTLWLVFVVSWYKIILYFTLLED